MNKEKGGLWSVNEECSQQNKKKKVKTKQVKVLPVRGHVKESKNKKRLFNCPNISL